jgi:pyrophosphatase PpaX
MPVDVTHVLFDLDGTLACTLPAILESYRYAFDRVLGQDYPVTEADVREALSVRLRELFALKAPERGEELIASFRERYLGTELDMTPYPYPGVLAMFAGLADRGLVVGLVTNKTRVAAVHELARCGLAGVPFGCVITADEASRGKPDPLPILLGLAAAGCRNPDAALYLGDAVEDMHAARAAGVRGIGAGWGEGGADALRATGAFAIIDAPLDLLTVVDAQIGVAR